MSGKFCEYIGIKSPLTEAFLYLYSQNLPLIYRLLSFVLDILLNMSEEIKQYILCLIELLKNFYVALDIIGHAYGVEFLKTIMSTFASLLLAAIFSCILLVAIQKSQV